MAPARKTRQETVSLTLGTHQESSTYVFVFAPGCAVAPNNPEQERQHRCDQLKQLVVNEMALSDSLSRDLAPGGSYSSIPVVSNVDALNAGQTVAAYGADFAAARSAQVATQGMSGPLTMMRYPVGTARVWGITNTGVGVLGVGLMAGSTVYAAAHGEVYETVNGLTNTGFGTYALLAGGPIGVGIGVGQAVIGAAQIGYTAVWNARVNQSTANAASSLQGTLNRANSQIDNISAKMEALGCNNDD